MFNNTAKVVPYQSPEVHGVILPHSSTVLTTQDVDQRIEKTRGHIAHLTAQLPSDGGGNRKRTRKISFQNQISSASNKLALLQQAKKLISEKKPVSTEPVVTKLEEETPFQRSFRRHGFGRCSVNSIQPPMVKMSDPWAEMCKKPSQQSSTVYFGGKMRTITARSPS